MGGFLGIGGDARKTDRGQQLKGYGELGNVFNFGMDTSKSLLPQGTQAQQSGLSDLEKAQQYWANILSGNRTATAAAAQPATQAATAQADAAKRQQAAMGTARTGGTAAANQTIDDSTRATIDNAIFATRPQAATETARIGTSKASIGSSIVTEALNALGLSGNSAANLTSIASGSRATSEAINQQVQQQWGEVIGAIMLGAGF